jgi:hypothetical protein
VPEIMEMQTFRADRPDGVRAASEGDGPVQRG